MVNTIPEERQLHVQDRLASPVGYLFIRNTEWFLIVHVTCFALVEICVGIKITCTFSAPLHVNIPFLVKHGLLT